MKKDLDFEIEASRIDFLCATIKVVEFYKSKV